MPNNTHNSHSTHSLPSKLKQSQNNIFSNVTQGLMKFILDNPVKSMTLQLYGKKPTYC